MKEGVFMIKKYELTNEELKVIDDDISPYGMYSTIVYRIRALKDFGDVKAGDLGGYVNSEENLSHEGNCWIYDDAKIYVFQ